MWMRSYTFDEYFIQMCGLMLHASYAPCLNSTIYKYFQDNFVLLQLLKSFPPLPKLCFLLTLHQVFLCLLNKCKKGHSMLCYSIIYQCNNDVSLTDLIWIPIVATTATLQCTVYPPPRRSRHNWRRLLSPHPALYCVHHCCVDTV